MINEHNHEKLGTSLGEQSITSNTVLVASPPPGAVLHAGPVHDLSAELQDFDAFGTTTQETHTKVLTVAAGPLAVPTYTNSYWTAQQRAANSLHEVPYRASFKAQLPRFYIERLTQKGDVVLDPFMGRGTTVIEAALLGRIPIGNDANPLSVVLANPRLHPPLLDEIKSRLETLDLSAAKEVREDLSVFYHPQTLVELCALREYLLSKESDGDLDDIDNWIRMVAINRLTGHSPGYFSVRTMPPTQTISVQSQQRLNLKHSLTPPYRALKSRILKKSQALLKDCDNAVRTCLASACAHAELLTGPADSMAQIPDDSVALVVTSPPFLDVVDYAADNWLRCWFAGIDVKGLALTVASSVKEWQLAMTAVLREIHRVLRPGGHVAFEVGEVRNGKIKLEESVLAAGQAASLDPLLIMVNAQAFTKTANCWGIQNGRNGTNTNRIVVFKKS